MISGRDTLKRMDGTLQRARRDLERLDIELLASSRAVTENKLRQARAIDGMARIRLDAAKRNEVTQHLEAATNEVNTLLAQRDAAIESLNEQLKGAGEALDDLEERRSSLHDDVDAAARQLAEREAAVQDSLQDSDTFNAQLELAHEAEALAERADDKAKLAKEDRVRKGKPFEADELFMYLWHRGYGTPEYAAGPLARLLDGWVARLCGYGEARANYWLLLEIPKRLAEHAEHARETAEQALDSLQDIEELAARDGQVPEARDALAEAERRQDTLDEDIEAAEGRLRDLQAEHSRYTAGEDGHLAKALRVFSATLERRGIDELMRIARATMTDEDDALVDELRRLRKQYAELKDELGGNRSQQDQRVARIRELEEVRRKFKRSRYDDVHSRFDKGDSIERMIGEVIGGVIQGTVLWKTLRRHQHYRDAAGEWPDFGSGGVSRRRKPRKQKSRQRAPSWHWPGPSSRSGGGGGFNLPQPPKGSGRRRRSRGGFKTGGGF